MCVASPPTLPSATLSLTLTARCCRNAWSCCIRPTRYTHTHTRTHVHTHPQNTPTHTKPQQTTHTPKQHTHTHTHTHTARTHTYAHILTCSFTSVESTFDSCWFESAC